MELPFCYFWLFFSTSSYLVICVEIVCYMIIGYEVARKFCFFYGKYRNNLIVVSTL